MESTNIPVSLINSLHIQNLWGRYNFVWSKLNKDVNILFGINGSGKTTVLDILNFVFNQKKLTVAEKSLVIKKIKDRNCLVRDNYNNNQELEYKYANRNGAKSNLINVYKINNFEVFSKSKSSKLTLLDYNLDHLIFKKKNETSFTFLDYRLKNLANTEISSDKIKRYQKKVNDFYKLINTYFKDTGKEIIIDKTTNGV